MCTAIGPETCVVVSYGAVVKVAAPDSAAELSAVQPAPRSTRPAVHCAEVRAHSPDVGLGWIVDFASVVGAFSRSDPPGVRKRRL
jgi:hypothetical protein